MDERISFWANPTRWPQDAMGYIFLGNAVNRVGSFLFPTKWDGTETTTPDLYALKTSFNATDIPLAHSHAKPWQRRLVHQLVASRRPEFGRAHTIHHGPFGEVIPKFSNEEWAAGIQEAEKIDAERKPKLERRDASWLFIKKAILDGALSFVLLPKRGGAFSQPRDRSWWNVKDHDRIFFWCQINPKDPTGSAVGGNDFQYVFVDERELNRMAGPAPMDLHWSDGAYSPKTERQNSQVPDEDAFDSGKRDGASTAQVDGPVFTPTERDIHAAIQAIWTGGSMPSAKGQIQAAVDKYLKTNFQYTKTPDPKTYQRYFKKTGATFSDK